MPLPPAATFLGCFSKHKEYGVEHVGSAWKLSRRLMTTLVSSHRTLRNADVSPTGAQFSYDYKYPLYEHRRYNCSPIANRCGPDPLAPQQLSVLTALLGREICAQIRLKQLRMSAMNVAFLSEPKAAGLIMSGSTCTTPASRRF